MDDTMNRQQLFNAAEYFLGLANNLYNGANLKYPRPMAWISKELAANQYQRFQPSPNMVYVGFIEYLDIAVSECCQQTDIKVQTKGIIRSVRSQSNTGPIVFEDIIPVAGPGAAFYAAPVVFTGWAFQADGVLSSYTGPQPVNPVSNTSPLLRLFMSTDAPFMIVPGVGEQKNVIGVNPAPYSFNIPGGSFLGSIRFYFDWVPLNGYNRIRVTLVDTSGTLEDLAGPSITTLQGIVVVDMVEGYDAYIIEAAKLDAGPWVHVPFDPGFSRNLVVDFRGRDCCRLVGFFLCFDTDNSTIEWRLAEGTRSNGLSFGLIGPAEYGLLEGSQSLWIGDPLSGLSTAVRSKSTDNVTYTADGNPTGSGTPWAISPGSDSANDPVTFADIATDLAVGMSVPPMLLDSNQALIVDWSAALSAAGTGIAKPWLWFFAYGVIA